MFFADRALTSSQMVFRNQHQSMQSAKPRSRVRYALLMFLIVGLGLASRSPQIPWPYLFSAYAGDTLWALLVFLGLGFLFPHSATRHHALGAMAFAFAIEFSQLYHAPWLDVLRAHRLAALVLGQGFLWSDLVCYAVGVAIGTALESTGVLLKNKPLLSS